ncbi:MAG TPA: hypothetical protein VGP94_00450 [Tepidisphaeraceae bacterium]|nr:hypothetical protein [Tepidisphaeraceae bacterium]
MTSTTSSAKVPPGGKPSAGKTPITKKQILILCGIVGGIAVVVAAWFIWQKTRPQMPRMDAPTPVLARYVMTEDFEKQPFDMQVQFMKQLDVRNEKDKKELDKAFSEGRISETEYRNALQMAWFGKHLTRVDKYFAAAGPQRVAYLDELALKKIMEDEQDKLHPKPPKEMDFSGNPSEPEERARIDKWPAEARERWYQFEKEYKARKKKIEEARAKTRPAVSK